MLLLILFKLNINYIYNDKITFGITKPVMAEEVFIMNVELLWRIDF